MFGYTREGFFTYLLLGILVNQIVFASLTGNLADEIRSGQLARRLVRPLGVFKEFFLVDLVDKSLNLIFGGLEVFLLFRFFGVSFTIPSLSSLLFFFGALVLAFAISFVFSLWLACLSFWLDQPWAIRWLFGVVFIGLFSGQAFPLDVFPLWFVRAVAWTPFPYLVYFPLKIWLGQVVIADAWRIIFISLFWLALFYLLLRKTWVRGLKTYAAYGESYSLFFIPSFSPPKGLVAYVAYGRPAAAFDQLGRSSFYFGKID